MDAGEAVKTLLGRLEDDKPFVICIAGPNGAGKSTFYPYFIESILAAANFSHLFLNADEVSRILREDTALDQYATDKQAQNIIAADRQRMIAQQQSFVFETVFSHASKVTELQQAQHAGFTVLVVFVGLQNVELSKSRVRRRVLEGGHHVEPEKLESRFPRTLENLQAAWQFVDAVVVLDNSLEDLPFQVLALALNQQIHFESYQFKTVWQHMTPKIYCAMQNEID